MSTKKNEIINKINQLTKQIIEHNENYHTYDNPKISDEEYDALYSELKEIENYNTRLYSNDLFEIEYKKNDFSIKEKYGSFLKTIIYLKTKNKKNYKILLDLNDIKYKKLN